MAGKRYSAGTIFLQVSPVFRRFQEDVQDYVKDIERGLGDDMEKAGDKAGRRAGKAMGKSMEDEAKGSADNYAGHFETSIKRFVRTAEKEIGRLDLSTASEKMLRDLDLAKQKLRELRDQDFNLDFNSKEVIADLGRVKAAVEALTKGDHDLNVDSNIAKTVAEIEGALKFVDKELARKRTLEVDVDVDALDRKMGAFERKIKQTMDKAASHMDGSVNAKVRELHGELERLGKLKVGPEISSTRLLAEVKIIMRELHKVSNTDVEIDARFEAGRAYADLAAFSKAVDHVDGRVIRVRAKADTNQASRNLSSVARSGDQAANSFRSFNIIILAAAGAGPALIPILGAIAGGLLAIGPAALVAVAGLGAVLVGFSGIGDAVGALNEREDARAQTVRDLGNASKAAARAEADGARRVADARRAAARQVESALNAQRDAQDRYRDSVDAVREAEIALASSRRAARNTGVEIKEKISDNSRAQDQGLLDVFNATVADNAVQSDGSATNAEKEQSRIDLENTRDALADLRKEGRELAKEQKKWRRDGINGTDEVKDAQDGLNDALEAQKDAYEDLRQAAVDVERARADGARAVADAMRDSKRATDDAAAAMADMSSEQQKVDDAFSKLGPAGKRFARFLAGLREGFYRFRNDVQKVLLPQIEKAIAGFLGSSNGSVLRRALIGLADSFGRVAKALSLSFQGSAWGGFFRMLADLGPDIQEAYGDAFVYFLEALASILTTLAPYALEFAEGFRGLMETFAGWAASKEGANGLRDFMDHIKEIAPDVLKFIGALAVAMTAVLVALAPYSDVILGLLTDFLELISNTDPGLLSGILASFLILITASQAAYAVMNLLLAGAALLTSTVGLLAFTFFGLALVVYYVYTQNETLGKVLGALVGTVFGIIIAVKIWKALMIAWRIITLNVAFAQLFLNASMLANPITLIIIAIIALIAIFVLLWKNNEGFRNFVISMWEKIKGAFQAGLEVAMIVLRAIGDAAIWLWEKAIKPALGAITAAWKGLVTEMKWLWDNVLWPVLKVIGKVVWTLWKAYFKVNLMLILALFKVVFLAIKAIWEKILWPVIKLIGKVIGWLWKYVVKPYLEFIGAIFEKVFTGMKWAWEKILKPVFDYIGDKALPVLKSAFEKAVDAIKAIWNGLKKIVGAPIKFVLDTIINKGLIDGFNKVAGWVGLDGFDHIPIPDALNSYATGGVMPGYTPGRDVHRFVSPTGGRLDLSGGEAVMRPEFTDTVGPDWVNQMNAAARGGGTRGVRKALGMGGYYLGGVLPLPGASVAVHSPGQYPGFAADYNYPGYTDYGAAIKAWKDGIIAQMNYVGDASYGRWAVLNHGGESSLYAHMSRFANLDVGDRVRAGQTIGYVGDIGNTGSPPTSHLHFEILNGLSGYAAAGANASGYEGSAQGASGGRSIPSWLLKTVMDPLGAVKNWVTSGYGKATDLMADSPVFDYVKKVPLLAAEKVTDKVWDIVPGWVKTAAGWAGNAAEWTVGGVKNAAKTSGGLVEGTLGAAGIGASAIGDFLGFANGGVLPYNGTMKYDNGGYLPPGLTSVVNLTGRPEPVFTDDQWANVEGGRPGGGNIHYEPHFEGSDLTASDVAGDLNFAIRKIRRSGRYEGVGR